MHHVYLDSRKSQRQCLQFEGTHTVSQGSVQLPLCRRFSPLGRLLKCFLLCFFIEFIGCFTRTAYQYIYYAFNLLSCKKKQPRIDAFVLKDTSTCFLRISDPLPQAWCSVSVWKKTWRSKLRSLNLVLAWAQHVPVNPSTEGRQQREKKSRWVNVPAPDWCKPIKPEGLSLQTFFCFPLKHGFNFTPSENPLLSIKRWTLWAFTKHCNLMEKSQIKG